MTFWFKSSLGNHVLRDHAGMGGICALVFAYFMGPLPAIAFWLTTLLVDVDHYLQFLVYGRLRHWSLPKFLNFHLYLFENVRGNDKLLTVHVFHTVEFFTFATAACVLLDAPLLWGCLAGLLTHLVTDFWHLKRYGIYGRRANSYIEYFRRFNSLKNAGIDADAPFRDSIKNLESLYP